MTTPSIAVSTGSSGNNPLTISVTLTGDANRLLMVGASCYRGRSNGSGVAPSSIDITCNGVSMTSIIQDVIYRVRGGLFYLPEASLPGAGTYNIVITQSGGSGPDTKNIGCVLELYNVDQAAPLGTAATNSGNGTSASVSISAAIGDVAYSLAFKDDESAFSADAQTTNYSALLFFNAARASYETAAANPETSTYTTNAISWNVLGVAVKGTAAAGGWEPAAQIVS